MLPDALPHLVGFGVDESPPDAEGDDWSLPLSDDDVAADVPALPVEVRRQENATNKLSRRWLGRSGQGLLISTLLLGSFFAGLQLFGANPTVPPVARQESREAQAVAPVPAVAVPPLLAPISNAKQHVEPRNSTGQKGQPPAPVAVARPKAKGSLYARVRQVVLENKTEETKRLGMGDVAFQSVPEDGSILVGMEVTYAPFFTHQVIKSVRPIYQKEDGTRYDGPVCGVPTQIGERVVAKEGYAIGGAAVKSGMGIDGMQLTFMEIGADGLNPNKSYLSKWLGGYGGAGTETWVNDGRPIVGVAGMWSKTSFGPAYCLCLVTIQPGALAAADVPEIMQTPIMPKQQEFSRQR